MNAERLFQQAAALPREMPVPGQVIERHRLGDVIQLFAGDERLVEGDLRSTSAETFSFGGSRFAERLSGCYARAARQRAGRRPRPGFDLPAVNRHSRIAMVSEGRPV